MRITVSRPAFIILISIIIIITCADYIRLKESGELDISEDAFTALEGEPEMAEVYQESDDDDEQPQPALPELMEQV